MKKVFYILMLVFIVSCNNRQEVNNKIVIDNTETENNDNELINNGLSKAVIRIIDEMFLFYDSLDDGWNANILDLGLSKVEGDCYLFAIRDLCYSPWLEYYTIIDDKLIGIYEITDECNCDFFDTTKLNKFNGISLELLLDTTIDRVKVQELRKNITKIEGFPDRSPMQGETVGRKYKVHSKDSLELVYTGRL